MVFRRSRLDRGAKRIINKILLQPVTDEIGFMVAGRLLRGRHALFGSPGRGWKSKLSVGRYHGLTPLAQRQADPMASPDIGRGRSMISPTLMTEMPAAPNTMTTRYASRYLNAHATESRWLAPCNPWLRISPAWRNSAPTATFVSYGSGKAFRNLCKIPRI